MLPLAMSHMRCRWAFVALLPCVLIGTAFSEAETRSGQDLSEVDIFAYPWSAIGKLNNSVGGSCTCTAVKQDLVLTAAHCIFNRRTGRFLQPGSLHLLFGYRRGEYTTHSRVTSYTLGPGYDPTNEMATMASDWAVLRLSEPLSATIRPLVLLDRNPEVGMRLMTASYGGVRPHVMTANTNCLLVGELPGSVLEHDCGVSRGSSGAPLLIIEKEAAEIVGVQVAIGKRNGSEVMLAASARAIRAYLSPR